MMCSYSGIPSTGYNISRLYTIPVHGIFLLHYSGVSGPFIAYVFRKKLPEKCIRYALLIGYGPMRLLVMGQCQIPIQASGIEY